MNTGHVYIITSTSAATIRHGMSQTAPMPDVARCVHFKGSITHDGSNNIVAKISSWLRFFFVWRVSTIRWFWNIPVE